MAQMSRVCSYWNFGWNWKCTIKVVRHQRKLRVVFFSSSYLILSDLMSKVRFGRHLQDNQSGPMPSTCGHVSKSWVCEHRMATLEAPHKCETSAQCKQQAVWWMFNPKRGESSLNRSPKLRPKGGLRYLWTTGWGGTDHRQSIGGTTPNVSGLQQTGRDH